MRYTPSPSFSVGAAGVASLEAVIKVVEQSPVAAGFSQIYSQRLDRLRKYREAYRRYCWPVTTLADYRLAPFHLLASEGTVHIDKTNRWHMETLHRLAAFDSEFIIATPFLEIDVTDNTALEQASRWWEELTSRGGEGMVVKPLDFIARGPKGLVQPAIKCRGREYRVFSASLRRIGFVSETVALRNPVMPVTDGFGGGVVGINSDQLR